MVQSCELRIKTKTYMSVNLRGSDSTRGCGNSSHTYTHKRAWTCYRSPISTCEVTDIHGDIERHIYISLGHSLPNFQHHLLSLVMCLKLFVQTHEPLFSSGSIVTYELVVLFVILTQFGINLLFLFFVFVWNLRSSISLTNYVDLSSR